jgi:hypothetical protein
MTLVENKSQIIYSKTALMDPANIQAISWSQSLRNKTENFAQLTALLGPDKTTQVVFFVQLSLANQLLSASKASAGDDQYETTVASPNFRYGQDSATNTTFRFLVYLDPSYNIFQHRFVNQTTVAKLASLAQKVPALNTYVTAAKSVLGVAQSVLGDPLRSFEG